MEEKREEDFEQKFDDEELDLTKDAFFSDLMEMEEEIANEAYELVEYAINLIESQFYDDSIEILRQAIGLYTQINRGDEIKAINDKISEVYLLKEKVFREVEIEPEIEVKIIDESEMIEEVKEEVDLTKILGETQRETELISKADQLIVEAHALANANKFEEALEKYDGAENILGKLDKPEEIERLYSLIEDCYNRKAAYLRSVKKEELGISTEIKPPPSEGEVKEKKLKEFLKAKKREEELSTRAYEKLDQAVEMAKRQEYDQAIKLYSEGVSLFEELHWTYEVKRIRDTIEQLEKDKIIYFKELEKQKVEIEQKIETELERERFIDLHVKEMSEQEKLAQMEKLRGIEIQKMEQEFFKAQIDNMATEAARMAREYELTMQKAIKEGELLEECIYPKVIEIYKKIKELLIDKGWNKEAAIYDDTINIYIQKLEKDKKIRQIEAEKVKRKEETEDLLKEKEESIEALISEEQQRVIEDQHQKAIEIQNIRNKFEEMTTRAERLAREYEVALRQGKFELKCPYLEIIKIFEKAREMALEKEWDTDVTIFSSQIYTYKQKLEKDNRLRQIEADKARKQDEIEETFKIKKEEPLVGLDSEKLRVLEEQKRREEEEEDFDTVIDVMANRAEKMARDYNFEMKKAIKKGKLAENPPFLKIIGVYERVKRMLLEKGREEEAAVYNNQINYYSQKLEQDNKLREVEAKKVQREKALEEMHKIGKEIGVDEERLKVIESKKEQENFENYIRDNVNRAEKMVRNYEMAMRRAYKSGEILKSNPYLEVIEIYKQLRENVYARGWKEQAEVFANQIRIYQEKLKKYENLLKIEAEKDQREKAIEEMHKIGKKGRVDEERPKTIEKRIEEDDFEKLISDDVDRAEKLVRDYEMAMRRAYKSGEILKSTPYLEVIEIYKQIREKVYARGWKEQAEVFANQIRIYQEKLNKHENLLKMEAEKDQREKAIEDMHKTGKILEVEKKKLSSIQRKKEEKEFQKYITEIVNEAEKLERDFDSAMKKAIKKGEVVEQTPYPDIIGIYSQVKDKLIDRGWIDQSQIYLNQIKIYQEKLEKHQKLLEVEAEKAKKEIEHEEMYKLGKSEVKPVRPEKIKELEAGKREEDLLLDKAMSLIDEAERSVKSYELNIRKDILIFESPYEKAIYNYENARELFQKIGWNDEASRLINTIKFYENKRENDEKLREIEQKKLEKPEIELEAADIEPEEDFIERQKRLLEFEEKRQDADDMVAEIFNMIQNAERMAQEYELKIKSGVFDYEAPYEKIVKTYREARNQFEKIGWKEESAKLIETIKFYKERLVKDNKIRALEAEKVKKREEELMIQQKLLEQARVEQEKLHKKRQQSFDLKKEHVAQFETQKDKAFRLMDQAKRELRQNRFEKAIDLYKESEKIFVEIKWKEGINMVQDSIAVITNKKKTIELEEKALEQRKIEALEIEKKLEEKLVETQIIKQQQQEEKRREFLKIQREKEQEKQISEEAYEFLKEGTALMDRGKFIEAYEKFIAARDLFQKISWQREVSRINNELLFKLKREQKQAEILEDIKIKKIEEEKQMLLLKEEAKREREEDARRKKEAKRRFAKEEVLRNISVKLDKASKLIESFQYNEGILIMIEEIHRLITLGKDEEVSKINKQIEEIKLKSEIPVITLETTGDDLQNKKFEAAYKALDNAQLAMMENQLKRAISELNEAKFQLNNIKSGKKFLKEIDEKIVELRDKLGIKPSKKKAKVSSEDEAEKLRARINARREERKKKVLDILKKNKDN